MTSVNVRITQIDGKLPNLALMKLSHYHKGQGHNVVFTQRLHKDLFEPNYDYVYGSSIFKFSEKARNVLKTQFPNALIAGTGTETNVTVEDIIQQKDYEYYDYDIYPDEIKTEVKFSTAWDNTEFMFTWQQLRSWQNYERIIFVGCNPNSIHVWWCTKKDLEENVFGKDEYRQHGGKDGKQEEYWLKSTPDKKTIVPEYFQTLDTWSK